ncbi:MAG: DoxX family protein [Altererythrobacter sp.]|nr:DoxX family protein [Altererythrobacter sp.]
MAWIAAIVGRLCIAVLFVVAGVGKLTDPAGTAQFITSNTTLPGTLAVPTGIFEIVAGLLLALGFMTRLVAIVLAGFVALATLLFHYQVTDPMQAQTALKNLAVFGGLLMVFAYGQVSWRISTWKERDRRHTAEVAAARAEARADAIEQDRTVTERTGFFSRRRTVADRTDGDPRT